MRNVIEGIDRFTETKEFYGFAIGVFTVSGLYLGFDIVVWAGLLLFGGLYVRSHHAKKTVGVRGNA